MSLSDFPLPYIVAVFSRFSTRTQSPSTWVGHGLSRFPHRMLVYAPGFFALTRWLESLLFEVSPLDPLTFTLVPSLLLLSAFIACWVPAQRAARVDPMVALRYE